MLLENDLEHPVKAGATKQERVYCAASGCVDRYGKPVFCSVDAKRLRRKPVISEKSLQILIKFIFFAGGQL